MRALSILLTLMFGACRASAWEAYPESLYSVLRDHSEPTFRSHHALLGRLITESEKGGKVPPPGMAAELAYYSWVLGREEEALEAIRKEREWYPESGRFLEVLERFLPSLETVEPAADDGPGGEVGR